MNNKIRLAAFIILAVLIFISFNTGNKALGQPNNRKIVVFDKTLNEAAKNKLLSVHGAVKIKDLSLINASVVVLPPQVSDTALEQRPGILRVDDDVIVQALDEETEKESLKDSRAKIQAAQILPWGIDKIDAELVWPSGNLADPIKLAIIDTGISKYHPDLQTNIKGGYNAINPLKSWDDDNGHGSHVAGIAAALNNTVGVVGVGPAIDLYAVKVLNRNGSGFLSDVIEGLQWAVGNGAQVANMSLGTASDIQSFHDAVIAAYNAGVVLVAAAGNSGGSVSFPAAYPEVIAVSATDSNNNLAYFSSRGPEVDLAAPGVNIYSTYKGTGYKTLSGTSMAAPHVAGSAALVINTPVGSYDVDGDGIWDPSEVQKKLQDRAKDLGSIGFDNLFGWGLVNVYNAVQP